MHRIIDFFNPEIQLIQIDHQKYLKNFKTGSNYPEAGLGDYIKNDAFNDLLSGDGVSYIVFQENENNEIIDTIAFFTLVSSAIPYIYRTVDDEVYEAICGIPAIKIHMFAVNEKYQDVFYKNKPIAAIIFGTIIDIINDKSKTDIGIKAIYLHSLKSAEKFYLKNNIQIAEKYMLPFSGDDDDLTLMYTFIRDIKITYES